MTQNLILSTIFGLFLIGGNAEAQVHHVETPSIIESCKNHILSRLKDPDSAKFGEFIADGKVFNVRQLGDVTNVIVMVNARNSFGGYTGSKTMICAVDPVTRVVKMLT